jgi:hypothetical protein
MLGEIQEFAPQAILRDLHRPVKEFLVSWMDIERWECPLDGGRPAWAALRVGTLENYRVDPTELLHTHRLFLEAQRMLRTLLKFDWTTAPKIEIHKFKYTPSG